MPVLVTTSRRPTRRSRRLAKELCRVLPYFKKINRGRMGYKDLREYMIKKGFTRLIIIENYKGNPGIMEFLTLDEVFLRRVGRLVIKSLSLQVDIRRDYIFSSLKKVEFVNVDEDIAESLSLFFHPYYSVSEGTEGTLRIVGDEEELSFNFYDNNGKRVPPHFSGRYITYE